MRLNALSEVRNEAFAPAVSSASLAWSGFRLERHRIFANATTPEICFPTHVIGFLLDGGYKKDISVTGTRRTVTHTSGSALLYPAELPHVGHSFSQADFLVLYIEPKFVERAAREIIAGERIEIVPQPKFSDPLVADIARHLLAEVEAGGATGTLYAESLITALVARLVKNYSTAKGILREHKGGLGPSKLRRTLDYINDHIEEDVSLSEIAEVAGMSYYHFARMFKQTIGTSPHQYLLERRVAEAQWLLKNTNLTIAEIALRVGFCNQSHFTKLFRKVLKTTPKVYRESL